MAAPEADSAPRRRLPLAHLECHGVVVRGDDEVAEIHGGANGDGRHLLRLAIDRTARSIAVARARPAATTISDRVENGVSISC